MHLPDIFSILSMIAYMRVKSGLGIDYALSSRYITLILSGIIGLGYSNGYIQGKVIMGQCIR
jgi:hypothetical protein